VLANRLEMLFGSVSLVAGKIILGILNMVGHHQAVAGNLGHDGCGGYGLAPLVPLGNGLLGKGQAEKMDAVDQKKIREKGKFVYSQFHGFQGCLEDVQPVDLLDLNNPDGHRRSFLQEKGKYFFSFSGG